MLSEEGHEIQAPDILVEAYLCIATTKYDLIIIDADGSPAGVAALCEWIAQKGSDAEVIELTNWRGTDLTDTSGVPPPNLTPRIT